MLRILIAEDDRELRKLFSHVLSRRGYTVTGVPMSSTYNNACLAAGEFEDVHVVDTKNLSTGGGLLVLAAALRSWPLGPTCCS